MKQDTYKIKQDTYKTKVVFRVWNDDVFGVIALFPQMAGDGRGLMCSSYEHAGQHGAADTHIVVRRTRLATPKEYRPLTKELKQLGYRLDIRKRCTQRDLLIRMENAKI